MERGTEATLHSVKVFIVSLLVGGKKKKTPTCLCSPVCLSSLWEKNRTNTQDSISLELASSRHLAILLRSELD